MSFCCNNGCGENSAFVRHISRFIGETVTIFTTSGGPSGCGFSGTIISVNCDFVRLVTHIGPPPANPLAENICGECEIGPGRKDYMGQGGAEGGRKGGYPRVGSVCDIPVDRIAAFCHNAV
ncbi:MAG: putative rane protein [Herbinix sp.]|nr:putative rane protein [Herbinix sp.]